MSTSAASPVPSYFTGAMATVAWTGGSTWSAGGNNWTGSDMYGNYLPSYSWENKETSAIFNSAGGNVNLSGTVIAHGVTINSGATGYVFNGVNGGALTVTGGGITANENVTINAPVKIGAPQTWNVASGKWLTIGGDVHTIISSLTVNGHGRRDHRRLDRRRRSSQRGRRCRGQHHRQRRSLPVSHRNGWNELLRQHQRRQRRTRLPTAHRHFVATTGAPSAAAAGSISGAAAPPSSPAATTTATGPPSTTAPSRPTAAPVCPPAAS